LQYSPAAKLYSRYGESEREFKLRLSQAARELRDAEVDKLRTRYATRINTLEDRLRRAQAALTKKEAEARARKQDALLSAGETVFNLFSGRRRSVSATVNKVTRSTTVKYDIETATEEVADIEADLKGLQDELKAQTDAITANWEQAVERLEEIVIKPRRTDIEIALFALAWAPHWQIVYQVGDVTQTQTVPAF
jgi:chromosome segregation ATPase